MGELVIRRTQFSSCDECRRSRVACDATARAKNRPDVDPASVSCTRCLNRRTPCTFKVATLLDILPSSTVFLVVCFVCPLCITGR